MPKLEEKLTTHASIVLDWCRENKLAANATKAKIMQTTTWQKMVLIPQNEKKTSEGCENEW